MIRLDLGRNMLTFNEGRAEEDERVRRTGNMVVCLLLAVAWSARGGDADSGGKQGWLCVGLRSRTRLRERPGCHRRCKRNVLRHCGFDRRSPSQSNSFSLLLLGTSLPFSRHVEVKYGRWTETAATGGER